MEEDDLSGLNDGQLHLIFETHPSVHRLPAMPSLILRKEFGRFNTTVVD